MHRQVLKNAFWLTATQGSRFFRMLVAIYAARALGSSLFGLFSYVLGVASLVSFVADPGLSELLTREVAKHPDDRQRYLAAGFLLELALLSIGNVVMTIVALTVPAMHILIPFILFTCLLTSADGLRAMIVGYLRGTQRMELETLITVILNVSMAAIGFAVLIWQPSVSHLLIAYVGSGLLALSVAFVVIRRVLPDFRGVHRQMITELLKNCWPLAVLSAFAFIFGLDTVMLGFWRPASEIGYYAAGQRLIQIILVIPMILTTAVFPLFSALTKDVDRERQTVTVERALSVIFVILLPIVLGGILLAGPILTAAYGSSYLPGQDAFRLFLLQLLCIGPGLVLSHVILAHNQQRELVKFTLIASVSNLLLSILLIPSFGMVGAAAAGLVGQLLQALFGWYVARRTVRIDLFSQIKKPIVATIVMGVCTFALQALHFPFVLTILLSAIIYVAALAVLKEPNIIDSKQLFKLIK